MWCSVLFSISALLNAQDQPVQSKWGMGLYFSPNRTHHQLFFGEQLSPLVLDWRQNSTPGFGFNAGLSVHHTFDNHFELVSGIGWTRYTDRLEDIPIVEEFNEFVGDQTNEYQYNYASVPLRLNFYLVSKKVSCFITAGGSANVYLFSKTKSTLNYDNGNTDRQAADLEINEVNKVGVSLLGGVGVKYSASKRIDFRLIPMFSYSLTKLADVNVSQNNYAMGAQFGAVIKL